MARKRDRFEVLKVCVCISYRGLHLIYESLKIVLISFQVSKWNNWGCAQFLGAEYNSYDGWIKGGLTIQQRTYYFAVFYNNNCA